MLNLETVIVGERAGDSAQLLSERLGELGEVKDAGALASKEPLHPRGEANPRKRPLQQHSVEAADHAANLLCVALEDGLHRHFLRKSKAQWR